MAKKAKKAKNEKGKLTRNQKKAMQKSFHCDDPEDLDTQLKSMGLSTKNITGDGNCLFRALSDQYYGHDGNHKSIRQEICQFLKDNEEDYKFFVEDDQSFEHHIQCMSQNATYGGNMELAAFAKMKEVDIKVYQPGMIYVINGKNEEDDTAQVLHIAYHSWEHYSSVRNINGPYSGPPEINVTKVEGPTSPEEEGSEGEEEGLSSKEKVVLIACPGTNIRKIRRLLIKYKGDPDKVIDALYDPKPNGTDTPADAVQETKDSGDIDKVDNVGDIDKQEDLEEKDVDQGKEQVVEKKDNVQQDQVADQDTASTKEVPLITETIAPTDTKEAEKKPKKLTTRERKEQAKKRQKEAKLEKDRAKAARRSKYKQEKEDDPDATKSECIPKVATAMKEMYI